MCARRSSSPRNCFDVVRIGCSFDSGSRCIRASWSERIEEVVRTRHDPDVDLRDARQLGRVEAVCYGRKGGRRAAWDSRASRQGPVFSIADRSP